MSFVLALGRAALRGGSFVAPVRALGTSGAARQSVPQAEPTLDFQGASHKGVGDDTLDVEREEERRAAGRGTGPSGGEVAVVKVVGAAPSVVVLDPRDGGATHSSFDLDGPGGIFGAFARRGSGLEVGMAGWRKNAASHVSKAKHAGKVTKKLQARMQALIRHQEKMSCGGRNDNHPVNQYKEKKGRGGGVRVVSARPFKGIPRKTKDHAASREELDLNDVLLARRFPSTGGRGDWGQAS